MKDRSEPEDTRLTLDYPSAIMLRAAQLLREDPARIVTADLRMTLELAGLVCWNGADGEVWFWEFLSEENLHGDADEVRELMGEHLLNTANDPRAAGRAVVAGPDFDNPPRATIVSPADASQLVNVHNGYEPGAQLYRSTRCPTLIGGESQARSDEARRIASQANLDSERYLRHLVA
ncbi:hypothetical protein [Catenuloplanes japonicus]|uniref:hypothetical protein n=1 Tax=Catenuloplanes japonicus TaxID=33876 RepID=UPI00052743CB|nr:hypothetical protein [Catenuloplanes japonicus]